MSKSLGPEYFQMPEIEIRAAIYAILAGLTFLGGWKVKGSLDAGREAEAALAQARVVEAAQEANAAQVALQASITAQVSSQYEAKLQESNSAAAALSSLVHGYEAKLRSGQVPSVPSSPGGANAAPQGSGIDGAIDEAITACTSDSTQLQSLEDWVNRIGN
jgi:hypothetical protein